MVSFFGYYPNAPRLDEADAPTQGEIMNTNTNPLTVSGIIEHRGRTFGVRLDGANLVFDAASWARDLAQQERVEAEDTEYTTEERASFEANANALDRWVESGCAGSIPFSVSPLLSLRSTLRHATVTRETLDTYLDLLLRVGEIVPVESVDDPAFAIRNNDGEGELWVTNHRYLRAAKSYPGDYVKVVETTSDDLKAIIATYRGPQFDPMLAALTA
jgi:hypothetical protein